MFCCVITQHRDTIPDLSEFLTYPAPPDSAARRRHFEPPSTNGGLRVYAEAPFTSGAKDEQKASEWLTKAANKEYLEATLRLGTMYRCGEGVEKDPTKAAFWFTKAAERKNDSAIRHLADRRREAALGCGDVPTCYALRTTTHKLVKYPS